MTRLLTCGWETGDKDEIGVEYKGNYATISVVTSTPTPRSPGAYCLRFYGDFVFQNERKVVELPSPLADVWVRFSFLASGAMVDKTGIFWFGNSSGLQTMLTFTMADRLLRLHRGGDTSPILATASAECALNVWHTIEWRNQITGDTTGLSEVWLDSSQVIAFSGDNSATSVTFPMTYFGFGAYTNSGTSGISYYAFDDLAINDTAGIVNNGRIFDGRVVLLKPVGDGSNTALGRGGTDSGANWSQVDEWPASMADYVGGVTPGVRDTYALGNLPVGEWAVNCVEELVYGQITDATGGSFGLTVKSGATTSEGSAQALGTGPATLRRLVERDPNTNAGWEVAAVNAAEAGITVR